MATVTKDQVREGQAARWEAFQRLAKQRPRHRILGIELIRTTKDETAAIVTAVIDRGVVQYLVRGDAQGRVLPSVEQQGEPDKPPGKPRGKAAPIAKAAAYVPTVDGIAFGGPPPKQDPPPGIAAVASVAMAAAFNAGEFVDPEGDS